MIDYVYGGEFVNVTSNKGATPYISHNTNPMQGAVTYDLASQNMKVYDGNCWQPVGGGSAMVTLTPTAISILKWSEKKMIEEQELQELCDSNPAIKDIVSNMNISMAEYRDKIDMIKILIKEEKV